MAVWKRGEQQLALSLQCDALEYASFFWAGASASLWIVCSIVHASGLRSLGIFQCLSSLARTLKWDKISTCCLSKRWFIAGGGDSLVLRLPLP